MDRATVTATERVERAALADLHSAASTDAARRLGLQLETVDGALVSLAKGDPGILVNRTIGLGVTHAATQEAVTEIASRYSAAGVNRYFIHLDPHATPSRLPGWLEESGLSPYHRAWAKFVRDPLPPDQPTSGLVVRRIGPEHAELFAHIAAGGFGLDPAWHDVLAGLVERPGWRVYLSFDHGEPAGCAAMRILDGVAWFDWAATSPEFRRLGSLGLLLARRIADAVRLGVRLMVTATGEAVPGDPQHSYRNILRHGFRFSHSRANWVPAPRNP